MNKPDWPSLIPEASRTQEVLVDRQIRAAIAKGQLISNGSAEESSKYACYELRIGPTVQQLATDGAQGGEGDLYRAKAIPETGIFTIKPGETFKIFSVEELYMPADTFAITIPVGNLYKLGLNPETSFADPGFAGSFFVTVCNYSARVVKLKVGDPLARIFFFHLSHRPDRIHEGRPRDVPPSIERVQKPADADLITKGEPALLREILAQVDPPHYEHAFVTHRIVSMHRTEAENRISQMESQFSVVTLSSLASLLLVICLGVFWAGQLLHMYLPTLFASVMSRLVTGLILWIGLLIFTPIRTAGWNALRILFKRKPNGAR